MDVPMQEAQAAEKIYSIWFGKSEFTHVAITQQPQLNFGQSWPNLVYLALWAYLDPTQRYMLLNRHRTGADGLRGRGDGARSVAPMVGAYGRLEYVPRSMAIGRLRDLLSRAVPATHRKGPRQVFEVLAKRPTVPAGEERLRQSAK
ncbi:MAG: hypothetical protein WDO73_13415 [Ignavibacteriota bacterium]